MRVSVDWRLSDPSLDTAQPSSQRQLAVALSALPEGGGGGAAVNLCLVLDRSGSMGGRALETVKAAVGEILERLSPRDRISIVTFDHRAEVLVDNQPASDPTAIQRQVATLQAGGGTAIDEGLKFGIEAVAKGKTDGTVSQIFLLTDGENEHGDNARCLKIAQLAAGYGITVSSLGFGDHWNQDVLEQIADAGGGSLTYIQRPESAVAAFTALFDRVQSVGLTNAHLQLTLQPGVRLAELKPIAQVQPDTIELDVQKNGSEATVRLGDLMVDIARVVLVNVYLEPLTAGTHPIATVQVSYDDPTQGRADLLSERLTVEVTALPTYQPAPDPVVQRYILALAKYRQTQIAESKLKAGDRQGAVTMLQSAAKTAIQMGDQGAATVLQENATQLQAGKDLSESARKQTRIVSKTQLQ
ncbi:MAG: VWA domain-containing protein [Cyanobacteria bacterium P01_A01_bin.105]